MMRAFPSTAVRDAEEPLLTAGEPLMERASFALATQVITLLRGARVRPSGTTVLSLVGPGDNGADALYASALLARRGVAVTAALLTDRVHEPGLGAARQAGVRIERVVGPSGIDLENLIQRARRCALWIDGIMGIGARGALREPLAGAVAALDHERRTSPDAPLVVAVDLPAGVGVDDGSVTGPVLSADLTVAMGALKPAHLAPPARDLCGHLELIDLDLLPALLTEGPAAVATLHSSDVSDLWPVPSAHGQKYTRGVLHVLAGSARFPGAAVLVSEAAHRAGVGMIRLEAAEPVGRLVLAARPEITLGDGRSQAHVVGPGLDDGDEDLLARARDVVLGAMQAKEPVVLDATGLGILAHGELHDVSPEVVLTPHAGELATLLSARGESFSRSEVEEAPARAARLAAEITGATVMLKGPTTLVAAPDGPLFAQHDGTAWLSTAGSGDVLAGVLGAVLAGHGDRLTEMARQGENIGSLMAQLAALAVLVHGRAAQFAAGLPAGDQAGADASSVGGPIAAMDVVRATPRVLRTLLSSPDPAAGRRW